MELYCEGELYGFLDAVKGELPDLFIVSQVAVVQGSGGAAGEMDGLGVAVKRSEGQKCERCWQYSTSVGESDGHPTLCARCAGILAEK